MRRHWITLVVAAVVVLGTALANAEGEKTPNQFVGAARCKKCHMSARKGAQYKVWTDSRHSHAFADLASDSAKAIAVRFKITTDPQKSPECLQCHVTGYGEVAAHFVTARADSEGVGCETCHGPGSNYIARQTMIDARTHKIDPASVGLLIPNKQTCLKCHNEKSPSGRLSQWPADSAKIAHPIPPGADATDAEAK